MLNIGIIGYGNLGKAAEQIILSHHDLKLVAIFSKRNVKSKFNTLIENYDNITLYKNRIDVMLLCGGSFDELDKQTSDALIYFDCINTFDNHKRVLLEYQRLNNLAKITKHRLIMSCGWDPGLFSIIRTLFYAISETKPAVFWGRGISMGHSDAIRRTPKVLDGIEFTIPNKETLCLARKGKLSDDETRHLRECFVVAEKKYHKIIDKNIKNIPDYFRGQPTTIKFVSRQELLHLKSKLSHKGEIITHFKTLSGDKTYLNFKLKTASNPSFTATIMVKYIEAIYNLKQNQQCGAFTPLDIPVSFLFKKDFHDKLIDLLC